MLVRRAFTCSIWNSAIQIPDCENLLWLVCFKSTLSLINRPNAFFGFGQVLIKRLTQRIVDEFSIYEVCGIVLQRSSTSEVHATRHYADISRSASKTRRLRLAISARRCLPPASVRRRFTAHRCSPSEQWHSAAIAATAAAAALAAASSTSLTRTTHQQPMVLCLTP